ncbi:MAG: peptide-methionine (S)-S-oxide reductase MsrA [Acaryochloris sp. RU_4_1]|nr:peptide-methionine (S)-S-oxide reductase MsrA [Acaryochloris sp. RU_4_1]NJR55818.1 peptide-methionine (S)-S-oxide reductase MsrA [Acaryochloris sp. CRU_2_0]
MIKRWFAIALLTLLTWLGPVSLTAQAQDLAKATFAGGCFWCMEKPFDALEGVVSTTSGYTGGTKANPTYKAVSSGKTGHAESVQVEYDPSQVSYEQLLAVFWHNVDPLDAGGQFCDRGTQYRTNIFYHSDKQKSLAEQSKAALNQSGRFATPIVTEIVPAGTFYPAEDYHQNYYQTNANLYRFYRFRCGRDQRLAKLWGE